MAINNFIPQVWSARILSNLQKALVYGQSGVINRDYEGEITAYGDTVQINSIGAVTVGDYTKNTNIGDPEELTGSQKTLNIDQSKYFNFQVDDIDRAQQRPKVMDEAMREAAYALADVADQHIASHYTDAGNTIGDDAAPETVDSTNAYDYLVDLSVLLTENSVPRSGRWIVVPPWFQGVMRKDSRFVEAGTSASDDIRENGVIARAAGFDIYVSNNVPFVAGDGTNTFDNYKIISGHPMAWSFAEQINSMEAYRPEKRFADAVKGLHLYGATVTRPNALAVLSAAQ